MNRYETVFILTPVLSEDQTKEAVQKFVKEIESRGGKVKHSESWGLKKMAYPVQKKTTGFYNMIEFEAPGDVLAPVEVELIRDERILRFLTVKMDAHHIAFAEKRKSKVSNAKKA
jgi:small subunit ribosomal protein S6